MGDTVGFRTNVLVSKNKLAAPLKKVEFDIMFGHGISEEGDILDQAMEKDVISKSSSWYLYDGNKIGQGRENAKKYLKDNPAECKKIVTELRKVGKIA